MMDLLSSPRGQRGVRPALILATTLVVGCASNPNLLRGNELLKAGKLDEAISAFESALDDSPDDPQALEGIRRARAKAVKLKLGKAKRALSKGDFARALRLADQAQRMPLDLDDVALRRRIDKMVDRATSSAEDRVRELESKGRFVPAVKLSKKVVDASPGQSRRVWSAAVQEKAQGHYGELAAELQNGNLPGSAALQLAMARQVGVEVPVAQVAGLWERFAKPVCFAKPVIRINGDKVPKFLAKLLAESSRSTLAELQARCGEGTRKLGVTIELSGVSVVDNRQVVEAAKAYPGVEFETVEVYYEEIPYTVVEKVEVPEIKIEQVEMRDCAPRPGQERGCRTWTEERKTEVMVTVDKEVEKVRRVRKTRPKKGPFPEDKVLTYELETIKRAVKFEGKVSVVGAESEPAGFKVSEVTEDSANAKVGNERLTVPADPQEAKSLEDLQRSAAGVVSERVAEAVRAAVAGWTKQFAAEARGHVLKGQIPQAEELYLRLLALGVHDDDGLKRFFMERYGEPVGDVMRYLGLALGQVAQSKPGERRSKAAAVYFPSRRDHTTDATEVAKEEYDPTKPTESPEAELSDDLQALEAESLGDAPAPEQEGDDAAPEAAADDDDAAGEEVPGEGVDAAEDSPDPEEGGDDSAP